MVDYFEVGAVRGDQPGAVRSSREHDDYIKMQVAELVAGEPLVLIDVSEYLARFQPVLFSRCQDGVIFLEARRNSRSADFVAPRHNSARTTDDVRRRSVTES